MASRNRCFILDSAINSKLQSQIRNKLFFFFAAAAAVTNVLLQVSFLLTPEIPDGVIKCRLSLMIAKKLFTERHERSDENLKDPFHTTACANYTIWSIYETKEMMLQQSWRHSRVTYIYQFCIEIFLSFCNLTEILLFMFATDQMTSLLAPYVQIY